MNQHIKRPKACLFDLDGVLIDSEPLHGESWKKTAAFFNAELNQEQLKLLQGRRRVECAKQIIKWIGKPIELDNLLSIHQPISKKLLRKTKAMPGAEDLVKLCVKQQLPIALVTSSTENSVKNKSAPHPWIELIEKRVQGDDPSLSSGKPSPEPYLLAAKKLNLDPGECWALEDSISGSESAINAGCKVWILNNNFKIEESLLNDSFPKNIHHINKILNILKTLI